MQYNAIDNITYCKNAERLALDVTKLPNTAKYYEVDTRQAYVVYNGAWYAI
jgi:hypothetical protein